MKWSVRGLLNFSYVPGINEAYEGTWADLDPPDDGFEELETAADLEQSRDVMDCSIEANPGAGERTPPDRSPETGTNLLPGWLSDPDGTF